MGRRASFAQGLLQWAETIKQGNRVLVQPWPWGPVRGFFSARTDTNSIHWLGVSAIRHRGSTRLFGRDDTVPYLSTADQPIERSFGYQYRTQKGIHFLARRPPLSIMYRARGGKVSGSTYLHRFHLTETSTLSSTG